MYYTYCVAIGWIHRWDRFVDAVKHFKKLKTQYPSNVTIMRRADSLREILHNN